ncbi:MAG: hypothetical protein IPJ65_22720 [Archangiaceae bacterium]|nr:hypothetical protein [Archangiaceae bacterium]
MELTPVRVGMMDSRRPESVLDLPVRHLGAAERMWRATRKVLGVSGVLLLVGNVLLLMLPFPHLHLCLFPLAVVLGPLLGWFAWRDKVVLGACALNCPRCHGTIAVPEGAMGWPARFNCEACGIMVELNAVDR